MGYDLHITRRPKWFAREGPVITDAEWRTLVEADAELRFSGAAEHELASGAVLRYENPLLAVWTDHPDEEIVWFDYRRGDIIVSDPDEATIVKMRQVARALSATVQGDDGELYD